MLGCIFWRIAYDSTVYVGLHDRYDHVRIITCIGIYGMHIRVPYVWSGIDVVLRRDTLTRGELYIRETEMISLVDALTRRVSRILLGGHCMMALPCRLLSRYW